MALLRMLPDVLVVASATARNLPTGLVIASGDGSVHFAGGGCGCCGGSGAPLLFARVARGVVDRVGFDGEAVVVVARLAPRAKSASRQVLKHLPYNLGRQGTH